MTQLKPMPSDYLPRYPRELTETQIRELLQPSLWQRFSFETLAIGALVMGLVLTGCEANTAFAQQENRYQPEVESVDEIPRIAVPLKSGKTTSSDPNLKKKVEKLAAEMLGNHERKSWNDEASIRLQRDLKANPPIKYPSIPISCGNSYVGIFDTEGAKEATHKMFAAYGIVLKKDVVIQGDGYQFVADGYNEELNVGFELVIPEGRVGLNGQELPKQLDAEKLGEKEKAALDGDLETGKLRLFVANAKGFKNMDGDLYTPLEYYLASVVDYLDWVHGEQRIDNTKLLGKLPAKLILKKAALLRQKVVVKTWRKKYPLLPNCDFEDPADVKQWIGDKVKIERSNRWSGNFWKPVTIVKTKASVILGVVTIESTSLGQFSLYARLEPGESLIYTVPDDQPVKVKQDNVSFGFIMRLNGDKRRVKVVLTGDNGESWAIEQEFRRLHKFEDTRKKSPFEKLKTVTIFVEGDTPAEIYLDDLGISREENNW